MMMEPVNCLSEDSALADALSKLEIMEKENAKLRHGINGASDGTSHENVRLKHQNGELMKVNHQWDLEFRELNEDFQRYRLDSQRAQADSKATITRLRDEREKTLEKYRALEEEYRRCNLENKELKSHVACLEQDLRAGSVGNGGGMARGSVGGSALGEGSGVPYAMVSYKKVKELEEECQLLRQQLKTYQDDFVEERKDRQRMNEEKQCAAVKHEAEVTSLKLQLERMRAELAHFTAEANRLSQQLRMKNQQEEEQYKKHLESKGYLTRSPSGRLPPMDPFVELDEDKDKIIRRSASGPSPSHSPRLLTRGVDLMHAYSGSPAVHTSNSGSRSTLDIDRARSPMNMMADTNATRHSGTSNGILPVPPQESSPYHNGGSYVSSHNNDITNGRTVSPTPLMNGVGSTRAADDWQYIQYGGGGGLGNNSSASPHRNRVGVANGFSNGVGMANGVGVINGVYPAPPTSAIPPMETKGRYSCPRCGRKFKVKADCTDHKERCLA